mgnify:CR=1 FL=1
MESVTPEKFEYLPEDLETIKGFFKSDYFIGGLAPETVDWFYLLDEEYTNVLNYCMDN